MTTMLSRDFTRSELQVLRWQAEMNPHDGVTDAKKLVEALDDRLSS